MPIYPLNCRVVIHLMNRQVVIYLMNRQMVIYLMKEKGYATRQIAPLMCRPERTINHAISSFEDRVKYSYNGLSNTLAIARQQLQE